MSEKLWETNVREYFHSGWNFRVKTVKGNEYITARKGQKERGLGKLTQARRKFIERFKDEAVDIISQDSETTPDEIPVYLDSSSLDVEVQSSKSLRGELLDKIQYWIMMDRGGVKMDACMFNAQSHCTYWTWGKRPLFFDYVDELSESPPYTRRPIQLGDTVEERWMYRASPNYCGYCSSFKKKQPE